MAPFCFVHVPVVVLFILMYSIFFSFIFLLLRRTLLYYFQKINKNMQQSPAVSPKKAWSTESRLSAEEHEALMAYFPNLQLVFYQWLT